MINIHVQHITGARAVLIHAPEEFSTVDVMAGDRIHGEVKLFFHGPDHFLKASAIADAINAAVAAPVAMAAE